MFRHAVLILACLCLPFGAGAQELNCKVRVNHSSVQGTNTSVFETLEEALTEFMNNRAWTQLRFAPGERIDCTLSLTVKKYKAQDDRFECELLWQLNRPVYGSSYNSTTFSMRDQSFQFNYKEYDPLEFNINTLDSNLTAMLAYYAYLFIGLDLDTFSPLGGTDVLQLASQVAQSAQSLAEPGWKAFDDDRNRHAIITDLLEPSLEPVRQFLYKFHREGLDIMSTSADQGRKAAKEALKLLAEAHSNKPLSALPQIVTDFKRDELVNIFKGRGTAEERSAVHDLLSDLNPSQNREWAKMKK